MREGMKEFMEKMAERDFMNVRTLPAVLAKVSGKGNTAVFAVG